MFISLIGTPCSGKSTIAEYLICQKGFQPVCLADDEDEDDLSLKIGVNRMDLSNGHASLKDFISFPSPSSLLDYVTRNWQANFVTTSLRTAEFIEPFVKRPFFLLVSVDGPVGVRYKRARTRQREEFRRELSLETFIEQHDRLFSAASPVHNEQPDSLRPPQMSRASSSSSIAQEVKAAAKQVKRPSTLRDAMAMAAVQVMNDFPSKQALHAHLEEMNLLDGERLRPSWDTYFMTLASLASLRSNCMKRRVGALLVRSKRILSTGYNGTPRGLTNCNEGGCARCNGEAKGGEALDLCLCLHAEENALLEAGRERVGEDAILYCNTCPCLRCSVKIVQTGVREVVYNLNYSMDEASAKVLREGGVKLRQLVMPHTST